MKSKTKYLVIVAILVCLGIGGIICCSILPNRVKNNVNGSEAEVTFSKMSNEPSDVLETELPITSTEVAVTNSTQITTEISNEVPTEQPTVAPTEVPTQAPTVAPTEVPTQAPTVAPTEVPTQAPAVAPTAAPTVAPTAAPTISACSHEWTVVNQKESVDCSRNEKYIETIYECACGEMKTDNCTIVAGCEYGKVYEEWNYSYTCPECERWTRARPGCVTHNFAFEYPPEYIHEDTHDKKYLRREPSCEEKGQVIVKCSKCEIYFIDEYQDITNETYPNGGGDGHNYVVVETGIEWKVDYAEWYYTVMRLECTRCGKSYYERDGGPDYYYDENGNKVNFE